MTYQEEMVAHLVHGGDPQVLLDAFMEDLNEAQKKADEQLAKEKKEAEANEILTQKREVVIAALKDYFTLVLGEEFCEDIIRTTLVEFEQSVEAIKNFVASANSKDVKSIIDLLFR